MLRFLLIRPDKMGDAVITQVVIEALAKTVPCKIDLFASNYNYKFYQDNPYLENVFHCDVEKKRSTREYYKNVCGKTAYDAVFVLQSRRRLQKLVLLSKCRVRIGFDLIFDTRISVKLFQWFMHGFYHFTYVNYNLNQHELLNIHDVINAGLLKLQLPNLVALPPQCRLYANIIQPAIKVVGSLIINVSGKVAEQKNILPSQLTALLLLVVNKASKIAIVTTLADLPMVEEAVAYMLECNPQIASIAIICEEDIFVVMNKVNAFDYYVGPDGGLLHIAAALGLKCVGLFNDDVKKRWYPWTPTQVSLSMPNSYAISTVAIINALQRLGLQ